MRYPLLLSLFLSSNVLASDFSGFSLSAQVGRANSEVESAFVDFAVDDFEDATLFVSTSVGYQFNPYFAVDIGYFGLAGASWFNLGETVNIDNKFVSVTGSVPLGKVAFLSIEYGRTQWDAEVDPGIEFGNDQAEGYDNFTKIGVGARWANHVQISINRFDMKLDLIDTTAYLVGFKYVF